MAPVPLDPARLSVASWQFAERLFAAAPDVEGYAAMEPDEREPDTFKLLVTIPSPTGDAHRTLAFWMDGDDPSLDFGSWHTHASLFGDEGAATEELLDCFRAIRADQVVLCLPVGRARHDSILDLREADAIEDELTIPYGTGTILLRSWGGTADRDVALSDFQRSPAK